MSSRPLFLVGMLFLVLRAQAQLVPTEPAPLFDHLVEVNKEWEVQGSGKPGRTVSFLSDIDRIAMHLACTIDLLAARPAVQVSPAAREKRAALLEELRTYAERRQFPRNGFADDRIPVFIDDLGTRCAVAHLMFASGHGALADRIHRQMNLSYVREMPRTELAEWAALHGFTVEELALVQPRYLPEPKDRPMVRGVVYLETGDHIRVVGYAKKEGTRMRVEQVDAKGKVKLIDRIPFIRSVQITTYQGRVFFGGAPNPKSPEAELYEWNGQELIQHDIFPGRNGVNRFDVVDGMLVVSCYSMEGLRSKRMLTADGQWVDITSGNTP